MNPKYEKLIEIIGKDKVRFDEPLAQYTTFKIGGPADLFYEADNEEELVRVFRDVRKIGVPYFILGGGSNILVGDRGFRGIVIKVQSSKCKVQSHNSNFKVLVDAGFNMSNLVNECLNNSLTGLEFMAGIPGTVGGAVRGNAGAWQKSIGERVLRVKVLTKDDKVEWVEQKDCGFSYRESFFKEAGMIILAVEFGLEEGDRGKIEEEIKEYIGKREGQPREPSAGCIFINPKHQSAGQLIEECGLKGSQTGGAKISEEHANFIINTGGALAKDVNSLIQLMKKTVFEKFGIVLNEEIVKVGESN